MRGSARKNAAVLQPSIMPRIWSKPFGEDVVIETVVLPPADFGRAALPRVLPRAPPTVLSGWRAEADNDVGGHATGSRALALSRDVSTADGSACALLDPGRAADVKIPFARCPPCRSASANAAAHARRGRSDANANPAGSLGRPHSRDLHGSGAVRDAMRIGTRDRLRHGRRHCAVRSALAR